MKVKSGKTKRMSNGQENVWVVDATLRGHLKKDVFGTESNNKKHRRQPRWFCWLLFEIKKEFCDLEGGPLGKVLCTQAWRPESGPPAPPQMLGRHGEHLAEHSGCRDKGLWGKVATNRKTHTCMHACLAHTLHNRTVSLVRFTCNLHRAVLS